MDWYRRPLQVESEFSSNSQTPRNFLLFFNSIFEKR